MKGSQIGGFIGDTDGNYRRLQWWIQDFPLGGGGVLSHWGGCQPSTWVPFGKMYVKTKELDPVGGVHAGGAPPRSTNGLPSYLAL